MKYFEGHPHPTLHPCRLCVTVTILASALIWEKEVRIDKQKYQNFDILFWIDNEIYFWCFTVYNWPNKVSIVWMFDHAVFRILGLFVENRLRYLHSFWDWHH